MSIIIQPLAGDRLRVSGDIAADLQVPSGPPEDRFHLAFSDGTLVAGEYDPARGAFQYVVETEGAGLARVHGDKLALDWAVEWVTVGLYNPASRTKAEPGPMPLFAGLQDHGEDIDDEIPW